MCVPNSALEDKKKIEKKNSVDKIMVESAWCIHLEVCAEDKLEIKFHSVSHEASGG